MKIIEIYHRFIGATRILDGAPALLIRLILAPVMVVAGYNKLQLSNSDLSFFQRLSADPSIVEWFGNAEWGLGLPFPELLANLAGWTEFLGGWLILIGLFTRLISIPLMFTMIVAATSVHWDKGWFAIAPTNADTSPALMYAWLGSEQAKQSLAHTEAVSSRLDRAKSILDENANTDWLFEHGNIVILNNGIEFAFTYFVLFLTLFFIGGGRFVSVDYWLYKFNKKQSE